MSKKRKELDICRYNITTVSFVTDEPSMADENTILMFWPKHAEYIDTKPAWGFATTKGEILFSSKNFDLLEHSVEGYSRHGQIGLFDKGERVIVFRKDLGDLETITDKNKYNLISTQMKDCPTYMSPTNGDIIALKERELYIIDSHTGEIRDIGKTSNCSEVTNKVEHFPGRMMVGDEIVIPKPKKGCFVIDANNNVTEAQKPIFAKKDIAYHSLTSDVIGYLNGNRYHGKTLVDDRIIDVEVEDKKMLKMLKNAKRADDAHYPQTLIELCNKTPTIAPNHKCFFYGDAVILLDKEGITNPLAIFEFGEAIRDRLKDIPKWHPIIDNKDEIVFIVEYPLYTPKDENKGKDELNNYKSYLFCSLDKRSGEQKTEFISLSQQAFQNIIAGKTVEGIRHINPSSKGEVLEHVKVSFEGVVANFGKVEELYDVSSEYGPLLFRKNGTISAIFGNGAVKLDIKDQHKYQYAQWEHKTHGINIVHTMTLINNNLEGIYRGFYEDGQPATKGYKNGNTYNQAVIKAAGTPREPQEKTLFDEATMRGLK